MKNLFPILIHRVRTGYSIDYVITWRSSHKPAAHFENIKPHNPSTENWCIPEDMEEGDYMMMDPACEVNVKGTREKNDGNEALEEGTSPPLDLDLNGFPRTWNRIYPFRCKQDKARKEI